MFRSIATTARTCSMHIPGGERSNAWLLWFSLSTLQPTVQPIAIVLNGRLNVDWGSFDYPLSRNLRKELAQHFGM